MVVVQSCLGQALQLVCCSPLAGPGGVESEESLDASLEAEAVEEEETVSLEVSLAASLRVEVEEDEAEGWSLSGSLVLSQHLPQT